MPDEKNSSSDTTLSRLFDELLELEPEQRASKLEAMGLTPEQRKRLRAMLLFDDVAECPADLREQHVASLDLPTAQLERLRSTLSADRLLPHAIQAGVAAHLDRMDEAPDALAESLVGTSVGNFRLIALIGQGGSSVVFRAERDAGNARQVVALKLLRIGLFSVDAQRRFRREQAILAGLTHPNIASLVEAGVSSAGIPYIAMEIVDGLPITHAADSRKLTIEQRLAWFLNLCKTIEAAHAALIVHRDLKPSNLLITSSAQLKVLDFGIAKFADADSLVTHTHSISLTPEYAAPEQFRDAPLTTAVDVYALGVLLGELLTGDRLDGKSRLSSHILAGSTTLPAGLPDRRVLARRCHGDLDAVVGCALAEEPNLRYQSAGAFADDVERYLCQEPVRAHPPSRVYRAEKFVKRHRAIIAVSAVLMLSILASLGVAITQRIEALSAATAAHAEAARADSMRSFLFNAFKEAEPSKPRESPATVADLIEKALIDVEKDRTLDPRARLEIATRLAGVLGIQGNLRRSGELLEATLRQAQGVLGLEDALTMETARSLEQNHFQRGELALARSEVDDLLRHAPPALIELRARLFRDSAQIASFQRDSVTALRDDRMAVALARTSGNDDLVLEILDDFGATLVDSDSVDEAIQVMEEVMTLDRAKFGEQSAEFSQAKSSLSRVYRRANDLDRAEEYAAAAVALDNLIYPGDHWRTANHLNALAQVQLATHDLPGAVRSLRESKRMTIATLGPHHPETLTTRRAMAFAEVQMEDFSGALENLTEALPDEIAQFGAHHPRASIVRADYGYVSAVTGNRMQGSADVDAAIADLRAWHEPDPRELSRALERGVRLALDAGDFQTAANDLKELAPVSDIAKVHFGYYWDGRVESLRSEFLLDCMKLDEALVSLREFDASLALRRYPDPVLLALNRLLWAHALTLTGDTVGARAAADSGHRGLYSLAYLPQLLVGLDSWATSYIAKSETANCRLE